MPTPLAIRTAMLFLQFVLGDTEDSCRPFVFVFQAGHFIDHLLLADIGKTDGVLTFDFFLEVFYKGDERLCTLRLQLLSVGTATRQVLDETSLTIQGLVEFVALSLDGVRQRNGNFSIWVIGDVLKQKVQLGHNAMESVLNNILVHERNIQVDFIRSKVGFIPYRPNILGFKNSSFGNVLQVGHRTDETWSVNEIQCLLQELLGFDIELVL